MGNAMSSEDLDRKLQSTYQDLLDETKPSRRALADLSGTRSRVEQQLRALRQEQARITADQEKALAAGDAKQAARHAAALAGAHKESEDVEFELLAVVVAEHDAAELVHRRYESIQRFANSRELHHARMISAEIAADTEEMRAALDRLAARLDEAFAEFEARNQAATSRPNADHPDSGSPDRSEQAADRQSADPPAPGQPTPDHPTDE